VPVPAEAVPPKGIVVHRFNADHAFSKYGAFVTSAMEWSAKLILWRMRSLSAASTRPTWISLASTGSRPRRGSSIERVIRSRLSALPQNVIGHSFNLGPRRSRCRCRNVVRLTHADRRNAVTCGPYSRGIGWRGRTWSPRTRHREGHQFGSSWSLGQSRFRTLHTSQLFPR
jgi:hypothetical protein